MRTKEESQEKLKLARQLMHDYAVRSGLEGQQGDPGRRYLWTDAIALQNMLALASFEDRDKYHGWARKLIGYVNEYLGKYAREDKRKGWISGLSAEEGEKHPTKNGLRIGKKGLERPADVEFDDTLEWGRDGQYLHYNIRWINALLQAGIHLDNNDYFKQAAEMSLAGKKFITEKNGNLHMYWKMSVNLDRPLVSSMGAQDPLEGLLSALKVQQYYEDIDLTDYVDKLTQLCAGHDWTTTDPLGLGGLLLDVIKALELKESTDPPDSVKPEKLFREAIRGLQEYTKRKDVAEPVHFRLCFRECGLSLGLNTLGAYQPWLEKHDINYADLEPYLSLADEIEEFWSEPVHRESNPYIEHLDINDITFAASILAQAQPVFYGELK